jgi:hypothetical protein
MVLHHHLGALDLTLVFHIYFYCWIIFESLFNTFPPSEGGDLVHCSRDGDLYITSGVSHLMALQPPDFFMLTMRLCPI